MKDKKSIYLLAFSALTLVASCSAEVDKKNSDSTVANLYCDSVAELTDTKTKKDYCIPDSINFDCDMIIDAIYPYPGVNTYQLILNDSLSIIKAKTLDKRIVGPNSSIQVILNKKTADFFKFQFYDLFSKHKSIVRDEYLDDDTICEINNARDLNLNLELNGRKITEFLDITDYLFTYDDPFYPQFNKILDLSDAIMKKIDKDIYGLIGNPYYEAPDWIVEEFNYDYYEPYSEEE